MRYGKILVNFAANSLEKLDRYAKCIECISASKYTCVVIN